LTSDEIDTVPLGPDAGRWTSHEAALLRACDELQAHCQIDDETWAVLADRYDERQMVELLLLIGAYRAITYVHNCVGMQPRDPSPDVPGNRFLFVES
jgi:hypothetical protein